MWKKKKEAPHIPCSDINTRLWDMLAADVESKLRLCDAILHDGIVRVEVVKCRYCKHRTEDGFCYQDIEGVSYKKTHDNGYCDKGEI